jgi:hypothetical protein
MCGMLAHKVGAQRLGAAAVVLDVDPVTNAAPEASGPVG